jgi:hypothetical protein
MAPRLCIALALALAVLPARAEMYKWVDSKGLVNYSNTPPPSAARVAQRVEERISVIGEDASTRDAVARMEERLARRAHYEALDWQQRQRAMVAQRGTPTVGCGYGGYCGDDYAPSSYGMRYYPAYYSPYSYGGRVFTAVVPRTVRMPHSPSRSRGFVRR